MRRLELGELQLVIPGRVGPFQLGADVRTYSEFNWTVSDNPALEGVTHRDLQQENGVEVTLTSSGDAVHGIICSTECLYKGENLIGQSLARVLGLLGRDPDSEEEEEGDDGTEQISYFESEKLMIWSIDGTVRTVQCTEFE